MKKIFVLLVFSIVPFIAFSQEPTIMVETNAGYSVGINLENNYQLDIKLYYPINRFGLIVEVGSLFPQNDGYFHFFIAPMYFIINTEKWRVPVAIGFDVMGGKNNLYYGIGGSVAAHYSVTRNFYAGINLGIAYAFDNRHQDITGYRTEKVVVDDSTGNAVFIDRNVPVFETKSHFGSYIFLKPSIAIGFQF